MVTRDVEIVIVTEAVEAAVALLTQEGFRAERHPWSIHLRGESKVSIQISTAAFYGDFPERAVPADVHGILLRVASLQDTLRGKTEAWSDTRRRQSKRLKGLTDLTRLIEAHPHLWPLLPAELRAQIDPPAPQP